MSMSPINPLAGILMGAAVVQADAEKEKTSQLRRRQNQSLDIAAHDDELEHQVESSQQVDPASNEQHKFPGQRRSRQQPHKDDADDDNPDGSIEHVDVTA